MRYCLNHCARPGTLWLGLGLLAMIITSGCGPGLVQVSGTVHVGDEPVTDGYVSFIPAKGGGAARRPRSIPPASTSWALFRKATASPRASTW